MSDYPVYRDAGLGSVLAMLSMVGTEHLQGALREAGVPAPDAQPKADATESIRPAVLQVAQTFLDDMLEAVPVYATLINMLGSSPEAAKLRLAQCMQQHADAIWGAEIAELQATVKRQEQQLQEVHDLLNEALGLRPGAQGALQAQADFHCLSRCTQE